MSITTGSNEIYFEQPFDKSVNQFYIGKPLTLVFSTNEGLLIKKWTVVDGSYSRESIGNFQMTIGCLTNFWIDLVVPANKTINIYWGALYEGSYDANTLPPYVPKGKHVEMLNCGVSLQPHNLLDNSDFRNPVNQRGKTSYSGGEYAIDRWKTQSGTNINIMDGFIRITGDWDAQQILGNKLIGTYTYAIYAKINVAGEYTQTIEIYENGSSIATSFCTTVGEWKIYTCTATFTGGTNPVVTINNRAGSVSDASIDVKWAALYEGAYDASTLPAYQPKGYAAELAECQRYYQVIPEQTSCAFSTSAQSNKYFASSINFPQMRVTPIVSLKKDSSGNISVVQGVAFVSTSEFDFAYKLNGTLLPATTNANYAGKVMSFYGIELNADL